MRVIRPMLRLIASIAAVVLPSMASAHSPRRRTARTAPENASNSADKNPRVPTVLVAAALVTMVGSMAWSCWDDYTADNAWPVEMARGTEINQATDRILYLDEALTMSARMAAATGDREWIDRYRKFEPELDRRILEVKRLAPSAKCVESASATDTANRRLVEMEYASFDLVIAERRQEALALLNGPEYRRQKKIYAAGIAAFMQEAQARQRMDLQNVQRDRTMSFVAQIGVTGLVMGLWCLALWKLVRVHRKLEGALRESQVRFSQVAENAGEWIWEVDAGGLYTYCSPAIERILGYRPHEVVGKMHFYDFFEPRTREDFKIAALKAMSAGETLNLFVNTNVSRDGRSVVIETSGLPIRDDGGRVIGYRGLDTDITDRKLAEEQMKLDIRMRTTISDVLRLQLSDLSLDELLNGFLDKVLDAPWLSVEPKGAIFLADSSGGVLTMAVEHGMAPALVSKCARVPLGRCLCGRAAAERKAIYSGHVGDDHEIRIDGMVDHGHCCLPLISSSSQLLGVLNLYTRASYIPTEKDKEFLQAVANVLAGLVERKRAEEASRDSENWLRTLLDNVQTGILMIDADTHMIVDANVVAVNLIGASKEHVIGRRCHTYVCPAEEGKCPVIDYGKNIDASEKVLVRANGEKCPILKTVVPLTVRNRRYLLESFIDISQQKRDQDALRESQEFLKTIINCIGDPIFVMDDHDNYILMNDAGCELAGKTRDQIIGHTTGEFFPPQLAEAYLKKNRQVLLTGMEDVTEEPLVNSLGRRLTVMAKKSLYVDRGGKRHVVGIIRDITERKQLEDDLRQSRDLLEQRVVERTGELLKVNEQIRLAQMDLVQSEKMGMLGQLVAGVAHEINTPTGAILNVMADAREHLLALLELREATRQLPDELCGWLGECCRRVLRAPDDQGEPGRHSAKRQLEHELVSRGCTTARRLAPVILECFGKEWQADEGILERLAVEPVLNTLEHLLALRSASDISLASARKIARIVRALRYYSHAGQDELADVNINDSIENALVILQNRTKHVAEVTTALDPALPTIRCGPDISQVWTNIINNACDAIEEAHQGGPSQGAAAAGGMGHIEIATRLDGEQVLVRITNDGPNISESAIGRVFDPFFTTKGVGKGTGLGLGICMGIIQGRGGTIHVINTPGQVSFEVRLPLVTTGHGQSPLLATAGASQEGRIRI